MLADVVAPLFCGGFVMTTSLSVDPSVVVSITLCMDEIELSIRSIMDRGVPKAMSCLPVSFFVGIFWMVVFGICVMSLSLRTVVFGGCVVVVVGGVVVSTLEGVNEFIVSELMICSIRLICFSEFN